MSQHVGLQRILDEWDSLYEFFKSLDSRKEKPLIIKQFEDPLTKPRCQFLNFFVKKLKEAIVLFQDNQTSSYELYRYLRNFFSGIAKIALKPTIRSDKNFKFEEIYNINLEDDSEVNQYYECFNSFKNERFKSEIEWGLIPKEKEIEIMGEVRELILEILHQSKHYLPLKDEYIDLFKVLKPEDFDRNFWLELEKKFNNIIPPNSYDKFIEDLDKIESYDFNSKTFIKAGSNLYAKWQILKEELDLQHITCLAQNLLTIPVSSASLERVFSSLRHIKNPLRTNLSDDSLEACLLFNEENLEFSEEIMKAFNDIHRNYRSINNQEEDNKKERGARGN